MGSEGNLLPWRFVGYGGKGRANSENESGGGIAQMVGNYKSTVKQGHNSKIQRQSI